MADKKSPEGVEFVVRLHPVTGDDVSIRCFDFANENEALDAINRAVGMRQGLVLNRAKYGRESGMSGMVVNMANVVSARVSSVEDAQSETGQFI